LVILDDADVGAAVAAASFGAFMNQGQICMSSGRIIVDEAIADEFLNQFVKKTRTLAAGDPRTGHAPLGSLVSAEAGERIEMLVQEAIQRGARLVTGGERAGAIFQPTVIDRVTDTMRLYREECFGPAAAVIHVRGEEEAIRVANDTEYGLSAGVFSRDIARAFRVAKRIRSGICHINGPTVHDEAQMPFGGMSASGYGRFGGKAAIAEFTDLRWITLQTEPRHYPF
jgi:acyl-CoA reductase-like NAD-dependent aldehyde dehydrogenase